MAENKTIYALSTLAGKSGVAVFRVSGKEAIKVAKDLTLGNLSKLKPREVKFTNIYCPASKEVIDSVLLTYFEGPKSFTGENVLEICTHGSIAVIKKLMRVFGEIKYLTIAEPGEFSKRAFLNSKMDLAQAEGLANLIEAETEVQQKAALMQMDGKLSSIYNNWRDDLISIMARIEALIDFPTEDIPDGELEKAKSKIDKLRKKISDHLKTYSTNEVISKGYQISIVGSPNAGKSSLMNYLSKTDTAIVSDISGTTRDVVSVKMDLSGYSIVFNDTAGLRDNTSDTIEIEGIKRSYKAVEKSNLVLFVIDNQDFNEKEQIKLIRDIIEINNNILLIFNKVDDEKSKNVLQDIELPSIAISLNTGYNCEKLIEEIKSELEQKYVLGAEPIISSFRVYENLKDGVFYLDSVDFNYPLEIVGENLRNACSSISRTTGEITLDEILDQVFGSFCIGK